MAQKYVGLDLGTHEIKAVLISAGLRTVQVLEVVVEPVAARSGADDFAFSARYIFFLNNGADVGIVQLVI